MFVFTAVQCSYTANEGRKDEWEKVEITFTVKILGVKVPLKFEVMYLGKIDFDIRDNDNKYIFYILRVPTKKSIPREVDGICEIFVMARFCLSDKRRIAVCIFLQVLFLCMFDNL